MTLIVRDFAYKPTDTRYSGVYPALVVEQKPAKPKEQPAEEQEEEYESDDSNTDEDWDWSWSFNVNKAKKPTPAKGKEKKPVDLADLETTLIPKITKQIQSLVTQPDMAVKIYRARTIFPFVKGTEYEMSLESPEELLIVSIDKPEPPKEEKKERWSSIDDLEEKKSVPQKSVSIKMDPPAEAFHKEIEQFLGYNKNYGDGWLTALKVKIYGNWTLGVSLVVLKDLGLVPGNYIEPI
ncbi:hypothetical protein HDV06_005654 [Boothiomyces sp. JEL0866]|nr:hypothetical protein HDV06_005654 [Boothiomyces sp. JEL0866]